MQAAMIAAEPHRELLQVYQCIVIAATAARRSLAADIEAVAILYEVAECAQ